MADSVLLNNRYLLQERLGSGGMAVVYKAQDRMLERTVSMKVLREDFSSDPAFRERFRQEAKAAANLSHPNIVTVHDFGYDDRRLFIVMEYVPGTDLKSLLEKRGRFDLDVGLALIVQVCAGVGYAHRAGLVHCDIKPHNILVTPDRRVKVTDFGIARALASINPTERSDIVWGSPQYFSPEQARGLAPSPSSDVYGIGVVLYEVITGQLPFMSSSSTELARLHRDARPIPPSELNPEIPEPVEKIILKVLDKEPSARYRTADQLGRVLMNFSRAGEAQSVYPAGSRNARTLAGSTQSRTTSPVRTETPANQPERVQTAASIDWLALLLGFVALLTVGGLVPFGIWVYFMLNPPLR